MTRSLERVVRARVKHLYVTFEHLIHEIAKFGVIGVAMLGVTAGLSNLFHFGAGLGPLTSFGLATLIAATLSYFANRHWTWRHRDATGLKRELPLFLVLSGIGLAISEIPVGVSEYILKLHSPLAYNISSIVVGTGFGMVWRFWAFRRWVFLSNGSDAVTAASETAVLAAVSGKPPDQVVT